MRLRAVVIHTAVLEENQRAGDLHISYRVRSRLLQVKSGLGCAGRPVSPPAPRLRSSPAQCEGLSGGGAGDAPRGCGAWRGSPRASPMAARSRRLGRPPRGAGGSGSQEENAPREQSASRSGLLLWLEWLRKRCEVISGQNHKLMDLMQMALKSIIRNEEGNRIKPAGHHHAEFCLGKKEVALCGRSCAKRRSEGGMDNQGDSLIWAGFGDKSAGQKQLPFIHPSKAFTVE
ncbi:unnamed protein product [Coccothraustes coccothraustes]